MRTVSTIASAAAASVLLALGAQPAAAAGESQRPVRLEPNVVDLEPNVVDLQPKKKDTTYTVDSDVLFAFDSSRLGPDAATVLDDVVEDVTDSGSEQVTIVGHTDAVGGDAYNQALSERRAGAVRDYLDEQVGVRGVRYTASGEGEESPVASNETGEGRKKNRRVTITYAR